MATPSPDELDFFRRSEPVREIVGKVNTAELDQYRRGEPFRGAPMGTGATTFRRSFVVIVG